MTVSASTTFLRQSPLREALARLALSPSADAGRFASGAHARLPVEKFEQRTADLSVDHPKVVENYREGHRLATQSAGNGTNTEDLRQAMRHYRALFNELVESRTKSASRERSKSMTETQTSLLPQEQSEQLTNRWEEIQASFVDRPQEAVEEADSLVADLMQRITSSFVNERGRLEQQWSQGDDVSTEDLRVTLTRYRSFFERLLTT